MFASPIDPLSNPKGVKLNCELCGKPAYLRCEGCRVTFYCGKEHLVTDWNGIHEKICEMLIPLRTPVMVLGSEEERSHRQAVTTARHQHLLHLTQTEAHKKLFESAYHLAIPAALQSLRFSMALHGPDAIELVPAYLLLGEASIGLGQTKQARDYLSLAKWAVMKRGEGEGEADFGIRGQMHRNFGLLYRKEGKIDRAVEQIALDIYYSSLKAGDPEHVSVTGGYFHLAELFQTLSRIEDASNLYDCTLNIWKTTLKLPSRPAATPGAGGLNSRAVTRAGDASNSIPRGSTATISAPTPPSPSAPVYQPPLDEAQLAEAAHILKTIHAYRQTYFSAPASGTALAESAYVLALLHKRMGNIDLAKEMGGKGLEVYEASLGREHSLTIETRAFLKSLHDNSSATPAALNTSAPAAGISLGSTPMSPKDSVNGYMERLSGSGMRTSRKGSGVAEQ